MATCHGVNKNGQPCGFPAREGDLYCRHHQPSEPDAPLEIYRRLEQATPAEKTEIVLKLIEDHPEGRLELPNLEGMVADLRRIDLSPDALKPCLAKRQAGTPPWWNGEGVSLGKADLRGANLQEAKLWRANLKQTNLRGANLQEANLVEASLQEANLEGADLRGANLQGTNLQKANLLGTNLQADLRGANLQGAYLVEANLMEGNFREADLRGANLQKANMAIANLQEAHLGGINLEKANLAGAKLQKAKLWIAELKEADLVGANLQKVNLVGANLQKANLIGANLQEAYLGRVNLQKANLGGANLQKANLVEASLQEAYLGKAKLQGIDLLNCDSITHIHLANAWLDKTRLRHSQLGGAIGEELSGDYTAAKNAYLILKQNFDDLGDYEGSSWAYLKERRMEKLEAGQKAWAATARDWYNWRNWKEFGAFGGKFLGDQLIEIVSNYGEGFWRVLCWIAVFVLVIGPAIFWNFGNFEWSDQVKRIYFDYEHLGWQQKWFTYRQILLYTIDTFTTANFAEIKPRDDFTRFASGCLAMWGIFLVGLLGFVAGNRIRRS